MSLKLGRSIVVVAAAAVVDGVVVDDCIAVVCWVEDDDEKADIVDIVDIVVVVVVDDEFDVGEDIDDEYVGVDVELVENAAGTEVLEDVDADVDVDGAVERRPFGRTDHHSSRNTYGTNY